MHKEPWAKGKACIPLDAVSFPKGKETFPMHKETKSMHFCTFPVDVVTFPMHKERTSIGKETIPDDVVIFPLANGTFPVGKETFPMYKENFPVHVEIKRTGNVALSIPECVSAPHVVQARVKFQRFLLVKGSFCFEPFFREHLFRPLRVEAAALLHFQKMPFRP